MVLCPYCSTENADDARFCRYCGNALVTATPAGLAPRRSVAPLITVAAFAVLVLAGGIVALVAAQSDDGAGGTITDPGAPTLVPETSAPTTESTLPETTLAETTLPATTLAETLPETTLPATTTPPAPGSEGDLGLGQAITQPPCDGRHITVLASAVTPEFYAESVAAALDDHPGSAYLRTASTCPSLRPDLNGDAIYVVYFGPFGSPEEACAARADGPDGAYVKTLSDSLPPSHAVAC